jgi:hypothetical protein
MEFVLHWIVFSSSSIKTEVYSIYFYCATKFSSYTFINVSEFYEMNENDLNFPLKFV